MTDPCFLHPLQPSPAVGDTVLLDGPEGRHAATVKRLAPGESVVLADGGGRGVRGEVVSAERSEVRVLVRELLTETPRPWHLTVVQALPKGDRAELAVEVLTEVGVDVVVPWQSARSVVRWQGERGERSRARWQASAREAAKQSRRLSVPVVEPVHSTRQLVPRLAGVDHVLVLHESAARTLAADPPPVGGSLALVVGPEGGITDEELSALAGAGGRPVLLTDTVLRTSTAGVVAVAQLLALAGR
ncbi:16S rRNA (uracil(1498)-N(3))-methyltransferase [Auraticoccus sp. F435]|uniref:Ribosomal RNA small subunit methyltransferase E n=1 Tax=Auraticoccus cholistanensis TaxID=2656650 RepID=A0A6A9V1S3_9ACTN|nr:16S rRNA (uracil(1498)-N(3))-methyltransferase [Auraticoccus cholistanensis]MVA77540.1 16S rRNA (uracil(1498)-N(3))-methyltransferase [Auraticoccus cholistanensis]